MSSLETFGRTLSETVAGDKLSASRVERVRDLAVEQFHRGEKLATVMIKVHRKASARTKLSSLYVFDAICRYAALIVRKSASGFDHRRAEAPHGSRSERGSKEALTDSASSFLRSASDVLMEIATSTMATVREDQQAKVVKVVDIWIKASTFDQQVLKRVKSALDGPANQGPKPTEGEAEREGNSIPSPYGMLMREETTPATTTATSTPPHIPSSLLALLGGSKSKELRPEPQRSDLDDARQNTGLDPSHLGILQQFAQQKSRQSESSVEAVPPTTNAPAAPPAPKAPLQQRQSPTPPPSTQPSAFVPNQGIGDLSQFNMSIFDPTNAAHWLQFAQHWHNTYQYIPSNQELLWAMMSAMQSQMYAANYDNSSW